MNLFTVDKKSPWHFEFAVNPSRTYSDTAEARRKFRMFFFDEGAGVVRINGVRRMLQAPVFLCLNTEEELTLERDPGLNGRAICFDPSIINNKLTVGALKENGASLEAEQQDRFYLLPFLEREAGFFGAVSMSPAIVQSVKRNCALMERELEAQDSEFWPCRSRSYLLEILFLLHKLRAEPRLSSEGSLLPEEPDESEKAVLFLHAHYSEEILIQRLTTEFSTNRTTLLKRFKSLTGRTVKSYLIDLRMRLAGLLLRDSATPISEVAERVGIKDLSHFGRSFKKQFGMSPRIYRERYNWILKDHAS